MKLKSIYISVQVSDIILTLKSYKLWMCSNTHDKCPEPIIFIPNKKALSSKFDSISKEYHLKIEDNLDYLNEELDMNGEWDDDMTICLILLKQRWEYWKLFLLNPGNGSILRKYWKCVDEAKAFDKLYDVMHFFYDQYVETYFQMLSLILENVSYVIPLSISHSEQYFTYHIMKV